MKKYTWLRPCSYNAINTNVLVLVYDGAELLESSISRLSPHYNVSCRTFME